MTPAALAEPPALVAATPPPVFGPVLRFEQVTKSYGSVIGVNHVSLELHGGITGFVGANGAGKSTLLKLATGHLRPTLGRVTVCGVDAWATAAKRLVGYCPDLEAFYEEMSGRQFVGAMARLCGFTRAAARRRTEEVLDEVGMADRADRRVRGYSKGMRQRVKLAQALLHRPRLLVLDEPLSGIDPIGRQELLALFRRLEGQGKCLLISSHELEELEKLTDHVVVMARGRVAAVGTLARIRELLDDQPLSIRVDSPHARRLAAHLIDMADVVGVEVGHATLVVKARQATRFFGDLNRLIAAEGFAVTRLEPLDDSAHAILGYILGGSGRT